MAVTKSHDFRTPLSKVRGLGSAKDGTEHFIRQRLTAIANLFLMSFFVFSIAHLAGATWAQAVAYLASPLVTITMILVLGSAFYHMKLGMQVVIEDYLHAEPWRMLALVANIFFALGLFAACAFAVLRIAFFSAAIIG